MTIFPRVNLVIQSCSTQDIHKVSCTTIIILNKRSCETTITIQCNTFTKITGNIPWNIGLVYHSHHDGNRFLGCGANAE